MTTGNVKRLLRICTWTFVLMAASRLLADKADGPFTRCNELSAARCDATSRAYCITGQVLQVNRTSRDAEVILRDSSGTARFAEKAGLRIVAGDLVVVRGTARSVSCKEIASMTVIGSASLPEPARASAGTIPSGACDWKFIRLQGRLQDVFLSELNQEWCCITLNCGGSFVHASTPNVNGIFDRLTKLTDSAIELDGVVLPDDGSPRTKIGRILHFSGIDSIRVVRPPPQDPFDKPDISATYGLSPSVVSSLGRHSVHGRVLARWNDTHALLRSKQGEIVEIAAGAPLSARPGDFVKAVGLPESNLYHINLTAAALRPDSPFATEELPPVDFPRPSPSKPYNMWQIAGLHGRTVRLTGIVRNLPTPDDPGQQFLLAVDNRIVHVNIGSADLSRLSLRSGSRVELSGTLALSIENWSPRLAFPRILGFFLVLRTADDVKILAQPPWWTVGRLFAVIGTLLAILVGILIWNLALRHLAARKGRELFKEQLGHVKADLRTEERTRLAVELHDTLAQNLTGVSMEIEAANDLRGTAPKPMLEHLGIAAKALKSCRDELRNCLWDLRSQALEEPDMTTAILRTLQPHVNDSQLSVRFNVPRARLSDNTAHALLRIIRELVINAIRHGNASTVKVAGTIDQGKLLCSVADNGCGFDPDNAPGILQGHFGLQGIRERIDDLGGEFSIRSSFGKGTKATISVPIPRSVEEKVR